MTVEELISILEELEPEAEVLITHRQGMPYELELEGVTTREEIDRADGIRPEDVNSPAKTYESGTSPNDVVLVAGDFLRHGSPSAWTVL